MSELTRPSDVELTAARALLAPWRLLTAPKFFGLEHIPPRRPVLVVANHTLMGLLDVPFILFELYERRGVFLHGLADHLHYQLPVWRDLVGRFGAIEGTRESCRAAMRAGLSLLVFPGGGREVFKHKGEKYQLLWKERMGFARLAIEHGYPIVPLSAVGAEDCYEIVFDADEILRTPLGPALRQISPRADEIPPIVRGIGPFPRPQRFYFHFGKPIETRRLRGREDDDAVVFRIRERTRKAVESGIETLLVERRRDPKRNLAPRVLGQLARLGISASPAPRRRHPSKSGKS